VVLISGAAVSSRDNVTVAAGLSSDTVSSPLRKRSSVIKAALLKTAAETAEDEHQTLKAARAAQGFVDGSPSGSLAGRVHRCEGALDAVAELEAATCPWMELAGVGSMVHAAQARALHAMGEARAATDLRELGAEKMDDINGRLDAGTRLFVLLRGMDPTAAPRSMLRAAHADLVRQQRDADAEAHAAASELRSVELCHAKLHYCLGRVTVLRTFAI
jgi:hypothetical protein